MKLHTLTSLKSRTKTRVGRGISAGQGKTAGRGTKGQKSRSGHNIPRRFEGGQTPLMQRIPKLHGTKSFRPKPQVISWLSLEQYFDDKTRVTVEMLWTAGLIKNVKHSIKVIGATKRKKSFTFDDAITPTARLKNTLSVPKGVQPKA